MREILVDSLILIGKSLQQSSMSTERRIRLLSDVDTKDGEKFLQHIFVVEWDGEKAATHFLQVSAQSHGQRKNSAFPFSYPTGNRVNAQGCYPLPCYILFQKQIQKIQRANDFFSIVKARLKRTFPYLNQPKKREVLAQVVAETMAKHYNHLVKEEMEYGLLMVVDHSLDTFVVQKEADSSFLWIAKSKLHPGKHLFLHADQLLNQWVESKRYEAKELGMETKDVSSFSNQVKDEVFSIYNKSWPLLSHTWKMPKSIYWEDNEWTKGIKISADEYEAFLYGAQYAKQIMVEMIGSRKKNKSAIFGIPLLYSLLSEDTFLHFEKLERVLHQQQLSSGDLHLEILAGLPKVIPAVEDDYRITLFYFSGSWNDGYIHVHSVIPNIVPSTATVLQRVMHHVMKKDVGEICKMFLIKEEQMKLFHSLPALLYYSFGSGYVWTTLQKILNREKISLNILINNTAKRLKILAKERLLFKIRQELVSYFTTLAFFQRYHDVFSLTEERMKSLSDWQEIMQKYYAGSIREEDIQDGETLAFLTGLILKQFSNSFYMKTKDAFVEKRMMNFGNRLTTTMVWKKGLLRSEELRRQWKLSFSPNYYRVMPILLLKYLQFDQQKMWKKQQDTFMTAFWSGYLLYEKQEEEQMYESS